MSNSFFIALTLGMAAVTFLIRFLVHWPRREDSDVEPGQQNAAFCAGDRAAGHHHDSDPERKLQHGVRFEKPEGDRRDYLHARQLPPGPGLGRRQRRRFTGFAQLFHVITYQKESTE